MWNKISVRKQNFTKHLAVDFDLDLDYFYLMKMSALLFYFSKIKNQKVKFTYQNKSVLICAEKINIYFKFYQYLDSFSLLGGHSIVVCFNLKMVYVRMKNYVAKNHCLLKTHKCNCA